MSDYLYFCRADDFLASTDQSSLDFIRKLPDGEETAFKPMRVRSLQWHRKYWAMISDISQHITEFDVSLGDKPARIPINSPYDLHTAIKLVSGHCITQHIAGTPYVLRIPKSTNFDSMTADEWAEYYPKVLDAIHQRALPQVKDPIALQELARAAS